MNEILQTKRPPTDYKCRTCLQVDKSHLNFYSDGPVAVNINNLTGIQITEDEFVLCVKCNEELNIAIEFRKKAIESAKFFEDFHDVPLDVPLDTIRTEKVVKSSTNYCNICSQSFASKKTHDRHNKLKHSSDTSTTSKLKCDFCESFFSEKFYLLRHIRDKHFTVMTDKKSSTSKQDQETPCHICGKILKSRGLIKAHLASHKVMTADDYWYCDLCPRKFKSKSGCTHHIQQRHVLKMEYSCNECTAKFKGKWQLKCHIKSRHTNIRDHKCDICGKGFVDKQKLQAHKRIHTQERLFKCFMCPQSFIHQTDLRRHVWSHNKYFPYKCNFPNCEKGFIKKSDLKNHQKRMMHIDEGEGDR